MKNLLNKNSFQTGYKQRPFDSYKSLVNKLDEETKRKLDKQRTYGMIIIVAFVVLLIAILAITGIGVDKKASVSGNVFADKEAVLIECFGDSVTEGYMVTADTEGEHTSIAEVTYPQELERRLPVLLEEDDHTWKCSSIMVKNYGQSGSILMETSSSRLSGTADIVLVLYTANNFLAGAQYETMLETNIESIREKGAQVFLLNYPVKEGSAQEDKLMQANHYIASVSESSGVPLIDVQSYFKSITEYTAEELFGADDTHLTDLGYQLLGDYAAQEVHQYYYDQF